MHHDYYKQLAVEVSTQLKDQAQLQNMQRSGYGNHQHGACQSGNLS